VAPTEPLGFAKLFRLEPRRHAVVHLGTASGDDPRQAYSVDAFFKRLHSSLDLVCHVNLLRDQWMLSDLERVVRNADAIYVSSGSTSRALSTWRDMGVDKMLVEAAHSGKLCGGSSAGALCWFDQCVTDSYGMAAIIDGLGVIPGLAAAHYWRNFNGRRLLRAHAIQHPDDLIVGLADNSAL